MTQNTAAVFIIIFHLSLRLVNGEITQFHHGTAPEAILTADGGSRISGVQDRRDKDIILGGLFTVHVDAAGSAGGKCGKTVWGKGMETLEAMFYAIDSINSDSNILPNVSLGYDIRDTCQSENIALDESVDLVLSNGQIDIESCELITENNATMTPVSATIGPLESFVTIPVASFFRLFHMPQVSYASTSSLLSNRDRYKYFFRTFPPDDLQAQAIIDIILYYNWDHVSTIYSNNLYGEPVNSNFHRLAKLNGICIDINEPIDEHFETPAYYSLAKKLANTTARVVVLFAAVDHSELLIKEVQNVQRESNNSKTYFWIASVSSVEAASIYPEVTAGMWGIVPFSNDDVSFDNYFSKLHPSNNERDPWFIDYYQEWFDCIVGLNCTNASVTSSPNYRQFTLVPLVIDAVYSAAYAIDTFLRENCQKPLVWFANNQTCQGQNKEFNGQTLLTYLQNVSFTSPTGNTIQFDKFGNVEGKYNILNYQVISDCKNCTRRYELTPICFWDQLSTAEHRLQFYSDKTVQFGIDESSDDILYSVKSQCQECPPGFVKRIVVSSCCGVCDPCLGQNYTNSTSSTQCEVCQNNQWGNEPLAGNTACVSVKESYLQITDPWAVILILLAIIGLIAVTFVTGAFIWFWNTPLIKSSGREQMVLILIGITLCFLVTVVYLIRPSPAVCTFQRIGLWFCFSLILSALFIKLIRIARIFMQRKVTTRPKFIGSKYQILFTFMLVGVQMVLVLISLVVIYPDVEESILNNERNFNDFPSLIVSCANPHPALISILMIYYSVLIIASNALAILTIRFPQNFNESKYVAFSTFALGLMWIAFVFTYLNTSHKFQTAVISFTIQMSALAVLLCLFAPRIFILLFLQKRVEDKGSTSTAAFNKKPRDSNGTVDLKTTDTKI